jgi:hypothetical protein
LPLSPRFTLARDLSRTTLSVRQNRGSRVTKIRKEDHVAPKKGKKSTSKKLKKVPLKKVENLSVTTRKWIQ